jgi:hypothetical protein
MALPMLYAYGTIIGYSPLLLSLLLLGGGANMMITTAIGNSLSNNDWYEHLALLGMGYFEEDDGGVQLLQCRRKGQR